VGKMSLTSATDEALGRSWYRGKRLRFSAPCFLGCWIGLKLHVTRHPEFLFALAAVAAVPVNFRAFAKRCHSSLYYRAGGTRVLVSRPEERQVPLGPKTMPRLWRRKSFDDSTTYHVLFGRCHWVGNSLLPPATTQTLEDTYDQNSCRRVGSKDILAVRQLDARVMPFLRPPLPGPGA